MISPFAVGDHFILAYNVHTLPDRGISGSRSGSGREPSMVYSLCWTGHDWGKHDWQAQRFPSLKAANDYHEENVEMMEQTLR